MWKIFITYHDKSKVTLTGKHKDIPLKLAWQYYMQYANGKCANAVYQQYPKKDHEPMDLIKKIELLEEREREENETD